MRDYGKVHSSFWTSDTIRDMSEDARYLALYLLTSPHGTISGVFRLPDGYVCEDLQWTSERVRITLLELLEKGFANRCETTKWVYICKHFEWNKPENPNQRKSAKKIALSIPDSCCWKPLFMQAWADFLEIRAEEIGTLSEPLRNPSLTNSYNSNSNSNKLSLNAQTDFPDPLDFDEHDQPDNSGNQSSQSVAADSCTGEQLRFTEQHLLLARTTGLGSEYSDSDIQTRFDLFRCYKANANTMKAQSEWLSNWRTWCQREKVNHAKQPNRSAGNGRSSAQPRSESGTQRAMRLAQEASERIASNQTGEGH
ncbi:hypothetical protein [Rheinheimera tilapiae]|uniref:DnaT DNA-binding domain-containing protein n=1 Tax=Rheinheimera tilapiae TaxID=875043 RepID=A0ABV6BA80_9GAMM